MTDDLYTKTTREIKVSVMPTYLEEQSLPESSHFVWAYTIQVENLGEQQVQLLNRHWDITDGLGQVQKVSGEGVVGEQPVLQPGEGFRYTSGAALPTPSGIMAGQYEMEINGGERFPVEVPAFSLDSPLQTGRPN